MDCREAKKRIPDYLDGSLEEAVVRELTEHLDACPVCKEHVDELKAVETVLHAWTPTTAPADFAEKALAAKETYKPSKIRHPLFGSARRWLAAAAVVAIVGLTLWVVYGWNSTPGFHIRMLEVAYLQDVEAMLKRTQSAEALVDVALTANLGTAQSLAAHRPDSSEARSNVAVCGLTDIARTPADARAFVNLLSDNQQQASLWPSLISTAYADEAPVPISLRSKAALEEYRGNLDKAAMLYQKRLESTGFDPVVVIRLGFAHIATGHLEQAFELVAANKSNFNESGLDALEVLEKAIQNAAAARELPKLSDQRISALLAAGAYTDAAEELKLFWENEDDKAFLRGWALARSGHPEEAIHVFDAVIDRAPEGNAVRLLCLYETGLTRARLGRGNEAARYFDLAAKAAINLNDPLFTAVSQIQQVYALISTERPDSAERAQKAAAAVTDKAARKLALELANH